MYVKTLEISKKTKKVFLKNKLLLFTCKGLKVTNILKMMLFNE